MITGRDLRVLKKNNVVLENCLLPTFLGSLPDDLDSDTLRLERALYGFKCGNSNLRGLSYLVLNSRVGYYFLSGEDETDKMLRLQKSMELVEDSEILPITVSKIRSKNWGIATRKAMEGNLNNSITGFVKPRDGQYNCYWISSARCDKLKEFLFSLREQQ